MHVALRCPKGKTLKVDGEDVVPNVHAVLDKVSLSIIASFYQYNPRTFSILNCSLLPINTS